MLLQNRAFGVVKAAKDVLLQNVLVRVVEGIKADFHVGSSSYAFRGSRVRRSRF
jgi:hypothetical protein